MPQPGEDIEDFEARVVVVTFEGERFSVEIRKATTVERNEYTYTLEEVASSRDEFVSWRRKSTLSLSGPMN